MWPLKPLNLLSLSSRPASAATQARDLGLTSVGKARVIAAQRRRLCRVARVLPGVAIPAEAQNPSPA
jgi:hypothetical protein